MRRGPGADPTASGWPAAGADVVALDAWCTGGCPLIGIRRRPEGIQFRDRPAGRNEGSCGAGRQVDVRDAARAARVVVSDAIDAGFMSAGSISSSPTPVLQVGPAGWEISAQQWQETIDTNLTGLFSTIKACVPAMIRGRQRRLDHQHQFGRGHQGGARLRALLRHQVRRRRTDEFACRGAGPYGIRNELRCTRTGTDTPMGNDTAMCTRCSPTIRPTSTASPRALCRPILAAPDLVSDIVLWLAGDESSLVTAAQIPAEKGYLKI